MVAKLDVEMLKLCMKRKGINALTLSKLLGYKKTQAFYYMLRERSIKKVPELSKILDIERRSLVVIE